MKTWDKTLTEENIGEKYFDIGLGKDFLGIAPKKNPWRKMNE